MSEAAGNRNPGTYHRESGGLEFDRVSFFTDAVYAIALLSWLAMAPVGMLLDRFAPEEIRDHATRPGI